MSKVIFSAYRSGRAAFSSMSKKDALEASEKYTRECDRESFMDGWYDEYEEWKERQVSLEPDIAQDAIDRQVERYNN